MLFHLFPSFFLSPSVAVITLRLLLECAKVKINKRAGDLLILCDDTFTLM